MFDLCWINHRNNIHNSKTIFRMIILVADAARCFAGKAFMKTAKIKTPSFILSITWSV